MAASRASNASVHESGTSVGPAGAERWGALLAGGSLAAYGLSRRSAPGLALAAAGAGIIARAYLNPISSVGRTAAVIEVERAVTVDRPAADLYRFWRDVANLPRFMDHLKEVSVLDDRRSHWVAKAPLDTSVEWDAEITEERPDELIAWRSLPGSEIPNEGKVCFSPAPGGRGTEVRVSLAYRPPAGPVGAALAKLFGDEPGQQVREDLRRFKAIIETGEAPTTDGQSSGRDDGSGKE